MNSTRHAGLLRRRPTALVAAALAWASVVAVTFAPAPAAAATPGAHRQHGAPAHRTVKVNLRHHPRPAGRTQPLGITRGN